jgi:L-malate glycosyltransferase
MQKAIEGHSDSAEQRISRPSLLAIHPSIHLNGAGKCWILMIQAFRRFFVAHTSAPGKYDSPCIDEQRDHPVYSPQISRRILGNLRYCLTFMWYVLVYSWIIFKNRVHVVHCNALYLLQPMLAARLTGRRLVVHVHEAIEKYPKALYRLWVRCVSLLANEIICVSRRDLAHFSTPKAHWLPNWVDPAEFETQLSEGTDIQDKFVANGHKDCLKLLAVSQIVRGKGQDYAIEILDSIRRQGRQACLYLAGGTNDNSNNEAYLAELKEQVRRLGLEESVVFLGELKNVLPLMPVFDAVLMPSLSESFSRVHLEAMYTRSLLVATDVGSTADLVTDGADGLIIQLNDPVTTARRILETCDNEEYVHMIREQAHSTIMKDYTRSVLEPRLLALVTGTQSSCPTEKMADGTQKP